MSKLNNALSMLDILSARSVVSVQELSDALEISTRAVQRLKDTIIDSGYHIETIMGPGGGYRLLSSSQIQPLAFDMNQRRILKKAIANMMQQTTVYGPDMQIALAKLSQQLNYNDVNTNPFVQSVQLNVDPQTYQSHLELLEGAIDREHKIKIEYQKNHQTLNHYIFEPYELVLVNQLWYLFGFDEKNRYLSLKINRINSIEVLDIKFLKDDEFSHRQSLSEFGYKISPVKVSLIVKDRDYLSEYIWGKNQSITWIDNHKFRLEVEFSNDEAARTFILRGGSNIYIEAPESLRNWACEEYLQAFQQY